MADKKTIAAITFPLFMVSIIVSLLTIVPTAEEKTSNNIKCNQIGAREWNQGNTCIGFNHEIYQLDTLSSNYQTWLSAGIFSSFVTFVLMMADIIWGLN